MRLILLVLLILPTAQAQPAATPDTLHLEALRAAAAGQDPRAVQPDLLARASRLRQAALRAQRLPQLSLTGQATLQNEVPAIPIDLPGRALPSPPHEQFRAQIEADWMLYDGGRTRRQAATEQARLAEELAGVDVTLYALREATTETFFGALLAEARARTLVLTADDLEARLRVVRAQAEAGATLAAQAAALEAELIRVRQQINEADATRRAALNVLADLTGLAVGPADVLALPDLDDAVDRALYALETPEAAPIERPELVRLAHTAARTEAEARVREAQTLPALSLFGQAGIGRPSPFDFLSDDVAEYGLAGVRLRWSLFDGGRARREAEALRLQARLAETEAAAFARRLLREIGDERAALARLDAALRDDERVIELREEVLRVSRRQLEEGVLLPDTYTDRLTDLAEARLTHAHHRIERAQAQARLLSALGRFPEPHRLPTSD